LRLAADIGVLGAKRLLANRQAALVERLGLRIATLVVVEHRQVVEAGGDLAVLGAERLLPDREAALVGGSASA
jgi:hypothetical protein